MAWNPEGILASLCHSHNTFRELWQHELLLPDLEFVPLLDNSNEASSREENYGESNPQCRQISTA